MIKKIIHIIPKNIIPSGGIKVHFQLSELETELGYDSCIAVPSYQSIPTWFNNKVKIITWGDVWHSLEQDPDVIIVGWEDIESLRRFKARYLVSYVQGEVFFDRGADYTGIKLWVSSEWNQSKIGVPGCRVTPFIDISVFYPEKEIEKFKLRKTNVLVQERKDGSLRWKAVEFYLPSEVKNYVSVTSLKDSSESEFAKQLRLADIFFAHSYPEGLGLPGLEAMASNTLVVGYTGGGGTDYMQNGVNCMICADGDAQTLATVISKLLFKFDKKFINDIMFRAIKTVDRYSKENTMKELKIAIDKTLGII
ncbi:MAG: glycosyltransferase [Candidatus Pacearchaeota archaeon]|jgi:glycosyltransferase involved in cell wall biosynthesis